MKPTIHVKLHRWNNSPYRSGKPYTRAVEVLYVRDVHGFGSTVFYNCDGKRIENYVLRCARTRAIEIEVQDLLSRLSDHFTVKVVQSKKRYDAQDRPNLFIDIDQLPEQI